MAKAEQRDLQNTPTWAVVVVCFVLAVVSILIEKTIHLIGAWLKKKNKKALYEALEKVKAELMLMGFISLLLTVLQVPISEICIPESAAATWHPCSKKEEDAKDAKSDNNRKKLLEYSDSAAGLRRLLAAKGEDTCAKGKVALVSNYGIHQLHILIFVLASFHIFYCVITYVLGKSKMRTWKFWEDETKTVEYQFNNNPERFRFARDTSFGRRHLRKWSQSPVTLFIMCFFRQFLGSVTKVDYLTLRHGFIKAHLAPGSEAKFDFQEYISRSLDEDFKFVVAISPAMWFFALLFLLSNTHGSFSHLWLPFVPFIILLLVGAKLQMIITQMGLRIQDRGEVVKGTPLVEPGDDLFWFNRPHIILSLIHFVLFQNAFQLAFFVWSSLTFGKNTCFPRGTIDIVLRFTMGVVVQFVCSYVTLPLYALVTQMGSTMRPTIFKDSVSAALKNWHQTARKNVNHLRIHSETGTPLSSRPATPTHGTTPVHLLQNFNVRSTDSLPTTSKRSAFEIDNWNTDGSSPPENATEGIKDPKKVEEPSSPELPSEPRPVPTPHQININMSEFSFGKRVVSKKQIDDVN